MANEEERRRSELANELSQELDAEKRRFANTLTGEKRDFFLYLSGGLKSRDPFPALANDLRDGLSSGKYKKPSEFFTQKCEWLFDGIILRRNREMFLSAVDSVNRYQYSESYWRRSFRSRNYGLYFQKIIRILRCFYSNMRIDVDFCDILALKLPEKERAYAIDRNRTWLTEEGVAYVLDHEPEKSEKIITGILNGESALPISTGLIRGICMSLNADMHEYLGRLLLAARLQEGLRQSICESADAGTVEAFRVILRVIDENNLIRFSSVKRAAGTWTGLMTAESSDLERISSKTLRLIRTCIDDEQARRQYLSSEDSMELYLALWAYGFYELQDAMDRFSEIVKNGSHHRLLTAGYFVANLDNAPFAHRAAGQVIEKYSEQDLLAVFLPYFMAGWSGNGIVRGDTPSDMIRLEKYYDDRAQAERFYIRLWDIYNAIPKKSVLFSPCIFPWHSAELTKSDVIVRLCLTAFMLGDNEKMDACCVLIRDCDEYTRIPLFKITLSNPQTKIQRAALTDLLADKAYRVREKAFELIKKITLDEDNYLQMESMLRYKAADMRSHIISLLYDREDDAVLGTAARLLSDKSEEKRTAGLDIVIRLSKDEAKKHLFEACRPLAESVPNPTTKEKILIDSITGNAKKEDRPALFCPRDRYVPEMPGEEFAKECAEVFMRYFPQSEVGKTICEKQITCKASGTIQNVFDDIKRLELLVKAHKTDEFKCDGTARTMDCEMWEFWETLPDGRRQIPFRDLWLKWYADVLDSSPERLMRMCVALSACGQTDCFARVANRYAEQLYGKGYTTFAARDYAKILLRITGALRTDLVPPEDLSTLSAAAELWFLKAVPDDDVMIKLARPQWFGEYAPLIGGEQIKLVLGGCYRRNSPYLKELFALDELVKRRCQSNRRTSHAYATIIEDQTRTGGFTNGFAAPGLSEYIYMAYRGFLSDRTLYSRIFEETADTKYFLNVLSNAVTVNREQAISAARGGHSWESYYKIRHVSQLLGKDFDRRQAISSQITGDDKKLLAFADNIYETVISEILPVELMRGDTPTEYSNVIKGINRIYGLENFIAILSALGKDTLERSNWASTGSKKSSLSHLLSVCIPNPGDNAEKLRQALKGTDITEKRIIEAALYSPDWLDIVEEYLGWTGFKSACYYFMAHMNEAFDDRKKAIIAKYTPLTAEELMAGAFDLEWFRSAYESLGEKRFQTIYDAAKYISDGAKHSRARKYADAALGRLRPKETADTVFDKRNKDLLMAYSLIPLADEDDLCERYLNLTRFLKESKQFGAQRSASEKKAVEIAMQNLAACAGYADVTRLTMRMESRLIDDSRGLFEDKQIEDVVVRLDVSDAGQTGIVCTKDGKTLKSVPAKLKKNEYILLLSETKKKLTEQYRRTKRMFEQAMEDSVEFTVGEIRALRENPVALPIVRDLVFLIVKKELPGANAGKSQSDSPEISGNILCSQKSGFIEGNTLTDYAGSKTKLNDDDRVIVAHPFALFSEGHWADYQRNLFDRRIVQPFKQVFRELYVKTGEEADMNHSLRYAGNQIQPAKTVACLKSRRWVADVEDGLQKVYYKENIVARIYAMADWFSPADIEAPTLEWVEFSDRKTGSPITISKVPDIIFSEVMRDVDLAVSVAHAGGVDPETSHSTIEMRAALLEFTLPLFRLSNVSVKGNHAYIAGKLASYTLHLGSGVVHKQGGTMINILPVHSQHRGKLFLPFSDDDPKTAEILSKALLLAEDHKIKDPMILEQIHDRR